MGAHVEVEALLPGGLAPPAEAGPLLAQQHGGSGAGGDGGGDHAGQAPADDGDVDGGSGPAAALPGAVTGVGHGPVGGRSAVVGGWHSVGSLVEGG
ncbi:MAG: hypothetical protein R2749_15770 [Acidimicrobiales bacterium]